MQTAQMHVRVHVRDEPHELVRVPGVCWRADQQRVLVARESDEILHLHASPAREADEVVVGREGGPEDGASFVVVLIQPRSPGR